MTNNKSLKIKIKPEINPDGWYAQCQHCWTEVYPYNNVCPTCGQFQDWSWFKIKKD